MYAYYNEIDDFAAETIENLILAGHVAPGVVDRRSIEDVSPEDLREFTQCHFFAGIAVWSLGLRRAGWSDDRPVWTGSCPCQPFSSAGKGSGFDDERHLWPALFHLIEERRPTVVFGEQVASSHVNPWIELVQDDLEAVDYRFGAVPFPSAGVGAPHIRDRTYWVADSENERYERTGGAWNGRDGFANGGLDSRLADSDDARLEGRGGSSGGADKLPAGPLRVAGPWDNPDWVLCRDPAGAKWRPVEPGTFPLAHGLARGMGSLDARLLGLADVAGADGPSLRRAKSYRVGALKAYGNAINAFQAEQFIRAYMDV